MAVTFKTEKDIENLKQGGIILAKILRDLARMVKPGLSAAALDSRARELMKRYGVKPSFYRYRPLPYGRPFPGAICVSVNEVIVHGVPTAGLILREGDLVTIDGGIIYKGLFTDSALSVGVGKTSRVVKKLLSVTKGALNKAIKMCKPGKTLGDIGYAVSSFVDAEGFVVAEELVGHGVGYAVHEDPAVPNWGKPGEGLKLAKGMVLALEPMVCLGSGKIVENEDGSFSTLDNSLSAHFEHTVVITDGKPIVVTQMNK